VIESPSGLPGFGTDDTPTLTSPGGSEPLADPPWLVVASGRPPEHADRPLRVRLVLLRVVAAALLVVALVAVAGGYVNRRSAEAEAVNDAARTTDLLATSLVQPAVQDGLAEGNPAAVDRIAAVVRNQVISPSVVRVKLWNLDGRIVYSDEPRLIGQVFGLDPDERGVLTTAPKTRADVTDLQQPENRFERGRGKLLEVYRPVWTPSGQPLLFETYAPYSLVTERSARLWRGFAGITLASLLLIIVLLTPIIVGLLARLREAQGQREALLLRAVEASATERRRIAATLHDGVVQELAATAMVLAGHGQTQLRAGDPTQAEQWHSAASTVRANVGGLRSLLVDIYPDSLHAAGLSVALADLAATVRGRNISVLVEIDPTVEDELEGRREDLVFRVAQECVRNAAKHSSGCQVEVRIGRDAQGILLTVDDDGQGFDVEQVMSSPESGHFGLRLLVDLCAAEGATLSVASAPGTGTHWRLAVPSPIAAGNL
jgi:two-component system NarL family sensor kinase